MLGGLTIIYPPVANFVVYRPMWHIIIMCQKYENRSRADKIIAMKTVWFFWPTVYISSTLCGCIYWCMYVVLGTVGYCRIVDA